MSNDPQYPLPPFAQQSADGPIPAHVHAHAQSHPPQAQAQQAYASGPIAIFRRDLYTATPRVFVTHILVAINLGIFALMAATSGGFFEPSINTMIHWGAGFGPLTTNGQPWRLFTEMFLHFGIIHVGMNMYVLWQGGRLVERLFGNFPFLVVYIFSGLAGSFLSLHYHPEAVAAGASGAVFGVYGALLGFLCVQRGTVPPAILKSLTRAAGMFVVYNIAFGFAIHGIDMYAHGGGLLGGFVLGMLLSRRLVPGANLLRAMAVAVIGTLLVLYAFSHLRPIPVPEQDDQSSIPENFRNHIG